MPDPDAMPGVIVFTRSRLSVIRRLAIPLLAMGYVSWSNLDDGLIGRIFGWLAATLVVGFGYVVVRGLLKPDTLALSAVGFIWRSPLARRPLSVHWADITKVGLRTRQSVFGYKPAGIDGVGFNYRSGALSEKEARSAMGVLGVTGWQAVLPNLWDIPTGELVEEFAKRIDTRSVRASAMEGDVSDQLDGLARQVETITLTP